jgi:hypothetical protein
MGHRDEDLHPLKEEPHPRGGVHQGGGIPHQGGGIPLQEGETPHQERETRHRGGGTHQQGRGIGQNPGHLQGKLIHLDIEGNMVDLDQGRHTQGITIKDLQGKKKKKLVCHEYFAWACFNPTASNNMLFGPATLNRPIPWLYFLF